MPVPADILADVRVFLDAEIQAGRRRQPIDPALVADFLAPAGTGATAPVPNRGPAVAAGTGASVPVPNRGFAVAAASATFRGPAAAAASAARGFAVAAASATPPTTPAAAAATARDVSAVAALVSSCRLCALAQTRTRSVPGIGNANSPLVMFVGEAPGRDEDLRGEPFVGRAGQLLDKMIAAMGFTRAEVFIANVLKCRPPDNRTPTPEEMARCLPFLRRQIALVRPKTLVALGATAFRGLVGDASANISKIRGLWQDFDGIPLMPTFHPAYLLRAPAAKRLVWEDLLKVLSRLGREPPPRVSGR